MSREKAQKPLKICCFENFQYFGTFWMFSLHRMIQWSSNLFHIIRHLETQVVPTRDTLKPLEISIFLTFTPLNGTLGKILLARKLHFISFIFLENLIKHCPKIFSTKRGERHTLMWIVNPQHAVHTFSAQQNSNMEHLR